MTTLSKIAEQVKLRLAGGAPTKDLGIKDEELELFVVQVLNKLLKIEHIDVSNSENEFVPPHAAIATYTDIPVEASNAVTEGVSRQELDSISFTEFWDTGSGFYSLQDGNYWATVINDSVRVDITGMTSNNSKVYIISFSNITYPSGQDDTSISNFINNCNGIIRFTGMPANTPNTFIKAGMANISVSSGTISFNYTPDLTTSSEAFLQNLASDTHTDLQVFDGTSGSLLDQTLGNIECLEYITNAGTLVGKATLPAQPFNLPRGMGVWRVYASTSPNAPYIPIPSGQGFYTSTISFNNLSNKMGSLVSYEYFDNSTLLFNKSLANLPTVIDMQLIVVDPAKISSSDVLPIPPEMEETVIIEVYKLASMAGVEDRIVDGVDETRVRQ